LKDY
jgi:hypothetical protein